MNKTKLSPIVAGVMNWGIWDKNLNTKEMENMIASILSFARDPIRSENRERFDLNALLQTLCDDMTDMGHQVVFLVGDF